MVVALDAVPPDIARILGPGEQVQLYVKQKIYHPKLNIDSVIITNERIILRHPHTMGLRQDFTDFSYTDVANAILDKGVMRSTVKCVLRFGGDPLMLSDLPNDDAQRAYGIIRENLVRYQTPFAGGYPGVGMVPMPVQQAQVMTATQQAGPFCRKCGQRVAAGTRFCGACGSPM